MDDVSSYIRVGTKLSCEPDLNRGVLHRVLIEAVNETSVVAKYVESAFVRTKDADDEKGYTALVPGTVYEMQWDTELQRFFHETLGVLMVDMHGAPYRNPNWTRTRSWDIKIDIADTSAFQPELRAMQRIARLPLGVKTPIAEEDKWTRVSVMHRDKGMERIIDEDAVQAFNDQRVVQAVAAAMGTMGIGH